MDDADYIVQDEEVEAALAEIRRKQATTPKREIRPEQSLKAFIHFLVELRESGDYRDSNRTPPLKKLLELFDAEQLSLDFGSWALRLKPLLRDAAAKKEFNLTVREMIALVWNRKADALLKLLDQTVPRVQDTGHEEQTRRESRPIVELDNLMEDPYVDIDRLPRDK